MSANGCSDKIGSRGSTWDFCSISERSGWARKTGSDSRTDYKLEMEGMNRSTNDTIVRWKCSVVWQWAKKETAVELTQQHMAKIMSMLSGAWPNEVVNEARVSIYCDVLKKHDALLIEAAARIHIEESKWFPAPADLTSIVAKWGVAKLPVGDAWGIVQRQLNGPDHETYQSCDPVIDRAVAYLGWDRIREGDPQYIRRDFEQAYEKAYQEQLYSVQVGDAPLAHSTEEILARIRSRPSTSPELPAGE